MEDVKDVKMTSLTQPRFVKPFRLLYTQDNRKKNWELVLCHTCVYIIIYNVTRDKLIFVKQFRPAAYFAAIRYNFLCLGPIYTWRKICRRSLDEVSAKEIFKNSLTLSFIETASSKFLNKLLLVEFLKFFFIGEQMVFPMSI